MVLLQDRMGTQMKRHINIADVTRKEVDEAVQRVQVGQSKPELDDLLVDRVDKLYCTKCAVNIPVVYQKTFYDQDNTPISQTYIDIHKHIIVRRL